MLFTSRLQIWAGKAQNTLFPAQTTSWWVFFCSNSVCPTRNRPAARTGGGSAAWQGHQVLIWMQSHSGNPCGDFQFKFKLRCWMFLGCRTENSTVNHQISSKANAHPNQEVPHRAVGWISAFRFPSITTAAGTSLPQSDPQLCLPPESHIHTHKTPLDPEGCT